MPGNFILFEPRKKKLASKRFATDADVKQAAASWLKALETTFLYGGKHVLLQMWDKYLYVSGDHVDV
jgi:hypothetical protein